MGCICAQSSKIRINQAPSSKLKLKLINNTHNKQSSKYHSILKIPWVIICDYLTFQELAEVAKVNK